jgi:hypothetical protein
MTRVKREITVMQGIADDLKRFIAMHMRDGGLSAAGRGAHDRREVRELEGIPVS